jgi:hypothetical protein
MPVYKQRTVIELARGISAFLKLDVGLVRGAVPGADEGREVKRDRAETSALRKRLEEKEREVQALRAGEESTAGVRPENMVWIFGSGRSGSTWLRSMMGEIGGYGVWEEPTVGALFGGFYDRAEKGQLGSANFIMGEPVREGWIRSIRHFVLNAARYSQPRLGPDNYLVIKEPNGSAGAPLLMEAVPESRLVFLLRDPRDVVASVLDASREGSWLYERKDKAGWKQKGTPVKNPGVFLRQQAQAYQKQVAGARRAYEAHRGPKALVKYEDLVADTSGTMRRMFSDLDLEVGERELLSAVEKHSWENIPAEKKGSGKFYRKGTPGSWREDLSAEQTQVVEKITGSVIEEFYPGETRTSVADRA